MGSKRFGKLNIAGWLLIMMLILGLCSGCSVPFSDLLLGTEASEQGDNEYSDYYYRQLDNAEKKAYRRNI